MPTVFTKLSHATDHKPIFINLALVRYMSASNSCSTGTYLFFDATDYIAVDEDTGTINAELNAGSSA